MNTTEIKKALYKQKPIAEYAYSKDRVWTYSTEVVIDNREEEVLFQVPIEEMGEATFEKELPAQLLIRWMVSK